MAGPELKTPQPGQIVMVQRVYAPHHSVPAQWVGIVRLVIEAGAEPPDKLALSALFKLPPTHAKDTHPPSRPSKYMRIIIETSAGRCRVFPVGSPEVLVYVGDSADLPKTIRP